MSVVTEPVEGYGGGFAFLIVIFILLLIIGIAYTRSGYSGYYGCPY
jgi:uncharacterized protein (TIGR01732 family)